jgi:general nucleoside transport system ATP-binding protein
VNSNESRNEGAEHNSAPSVELIGITKFYGHVAACDHVDLTLRRGRIHGILGENGAGKSTLMKVLIGLVVPDSGRIRLNGTDVQIKDPIDAARHGIGMVHQHLSLVESLSVWENVALGDVGRIDRRAVRTRVGEISEQYGLQIDPDAQIGDLTAGMRQRVEIIKCLRRDPEILIFDEPTSVLAPAESEFLFEALRRVVGEFGKAVALVSHKLGEIMTATDDLTIMRDGKVQESRKTTGSDAGSLARAMVGREVKLRGVLAPVQHGHQPAANALKHENKVPLLRIVEATKQSPGGRLLLDRLSLEVYAGEIVGVAGVEGNGQRALGDLLSSLVHLDSGSIEVSGKTVAVGAAGAVSRAGVSVIPEDRHASGCVLDFSVAENLFIAEPERVSRFGVMDRRAMRTRAAELIERFSITCTGPDAPMWTLSGGNQQRVVLARELSNRPAVLVAAQPTRGLDVGAIEYMSEQLRQAARGGAGVLLISTELEEVIDLSDRIIVISQGRIVGEMLSSAIDVERLGLLMAGTLSTT